MTPNSSSVVDSKASPARKRLEKTTPKDAAMRTRSRSGTPASFKTRRNW